MSKRELLHSVILSLGYVLLFLGIAYKANFITGKYAIIAVVTGLIVLYFREELAKKIPVSVASMVVVQTIGLILIFLGFKAYVEQYITNLWLWYILAGAILFNYAAKISKSLVKNDTGPKKSVKEFEI